ncbi:hypothetical protein FRX31_022680 [Thalictrum thalictroides]|uniref:F-box protein n=1 Tax=Thalictrum thalictroides TaxID=46969 RepID=A0A7J6VTM5_THATH|nr:hypothetical protein FRX31_022680 [Thalictrum thalictroides]
MFLIFQKKSYLKYFKTIPPKDLNRFKRVCKLWKSLISDPKFVKACLTHTQPDLMFQAFYNPCYQIFSLNILEENVKLEKLEVPLVIDSYKRDQLMLLSSCDGLLLLQNSQDPRILHVYNPTTGQYKNLPQQECGCSKSALVFDDSTGQYKVFGLGFSEHSCPVILTLLSLERVGSIRLCGIWISLATHFGEKRIAFRYSG